MKFLIVDDDAEIRLIAGFLLRSAAHEVTEAASADDAELALKTAPCDVVLMDVMLGSDDGVELATRLLPRPRTDGPRLIFLTGATRDEQVARMHEAGADGIVHKPFDPATFVSRLDDILQDG